MRIVTVYKRPLHVQLGCYRKTAACYQGRLTEADGLLMMQLPDSNQHVHRQTDAQRTCNDDRDILIPLLLVSDN